MKQDLCGLALSGGGIRSATFNLGLLQALHQMGILRVFDYVSTVSGGGYIGGFWSAWRSQHMERFPSDHDGSNGANIPEVRHLREFSHFLVPRMGILGVDTSRMLGSLLISLIPAILVTFSLIFLALGAWNTLAWLLLAEEDGSGKWWISSSTSWMVMAALTLVFLYPGVKRFRRSEFIVLLAVFLVAMGWRWMELDDVNVSNTSDFWALLHFELDPSIRLFSPCLAWLGGAGVLVALRWVLSRWKLVTSTAVIGRVVSLLLLIAGGWALFSGVYILASIDSRGLWLAATGALPVVFALFARVQQLASRKTSKPAEPGARNRIQRFLPQFLACTTLLLMFYGAARLFGVAMDAEVLPWIIYPSIVIVLVSLFVFDVNNTGLHAFYRARLARAYLGAAHGKNSLETEPQPQDERPLNAVRPRDDENCRDLRAPLHLICCAANDLSSDVLVNLYRGAKSAVFSPLGYSVDSHWVAWKDVDASGIPTLASAMTASGAALNTHMGYRSVQMGSAVTFLLAAFNLRLGMWWPHPAKLGAKKSRARRLLVGLPFYKELFGRSEIRNSGDVMLSDGGHFENLALYELVRRHCRYIVVSDCGSDANTAFDDVANAARRVREDFGVEIRIDVSPLRPGPDGLAQRPIVAGDIEYPNGDVGILLLIKPTLVGHEPVDVIQYKRRNTSFPHETTGDQSYDEAQWESYRRLGEHIAHKAFQPILVDGRMPETEEGGRIFARARDEWSPPLAGYEERFPSYSLNASELDRLVQTSSQNLFSEVFPELESLRSVDHGCRRHFSYWTKRQDDSAKFRADLAGSLHLVRRASLVMQEAFILEDLANNYNNPAYLGVMNYFTRWTHSPSFRMWWPLMRSLYPLKFSRFLEMRCMLPKPLADSGEICLHHDMSGYAMRSWSLDKSNFDRVLQDRQVISYWSTLHYKDDAYQVQVAVLFARLVNVSHGDGSHEQLLAWRPEDFYVPPGLWGIGIGEQFLRALKAQPTCVPDPKRRDMLRKTSALVVEILMDRDAPSHQRKAWMNEMQLYRYAGFHPPDRGLLMALEAKKAQGGTSLEQNSRCQSRWLVRGCI
ncbi:patatin-like phospholipase family protein [Myxococcus xanthus]|nr:patatin-like phospholipase family protein [Myxococcus xanthus]